MLPDAVLSDLKTVYGIYLLQGTRPNTASDRITKDDIQRWSTLMGTPRSTLCDQIAIYLARGFHNQELTFEFCDAIANDIFGVAVTSAENDWSALFYEVYCAFDGGEYEHRDRPGDPVEVYTRPYIAQIVAALPDSN